MPREQINYPSPRPPQEPTDPTLPPSDGRHIGDAVLHVTWSPADKGAHVQVALEVEAEYAKLAVETLNGEAPTTTYLYSPALTRDQINKMIRTLRHARDRAYGREEDSAPVGSVDLDELPEA